MKILLMGTRGAPARYGGFETAVEEVGSRLATRHEVIVYCRNPNQVKTEYLGMKLVNLPALRHRVLETLSHTFLSALHAIFRQRDIDVILLFNCANVIFLPLLRFCHAPVIIHLDGLESQRAKWGAFGKRYYSWAERTAARSADAVIADSRALAELYRAKYGVDAAFIAYGAPILPRGHASHRLTRLNLRSNAFHLVVARFEPENNVREVVSAYSEAGTDFPLVVVGGAQYGSRYVSSVEAASAKADVHFIGAIYDQEMLESLYANCISYVHGHSVGGTNPSLIRAMGAGATCLANDVIFNREVLAGAGLYWSSQEQLSTLFEWVESNPDPCIEYSQSGQIRVAEFYCWDQVTSQLELLFTRTASHVTPDR